MTSVALCADSESLLHPELIGLDGVNLEAVPWLAAFSSGCDMRDYVRKASCVGEAWAVSADDMEAINLAAAMRRDRPDLPIYLAVFSLSGSTLSRARAAGVTGVLSCQAFSHRFAQEKKRRALMGESDGGVSSASALASTLPVTRASASISVSKTPTDGACMPASTSLGATEPLPVVETAAPVASTAPASASTSVKPALHAESGKLAASATSSSSESASAEPAASTGSAVPAASTASVAPTTFATSTTSEAPAQAPSSGPGLEMPSSTSSSTHTPMRDSSAQTASQMGSPSSPSQAPQTSFATSSASAVPNDVESSPKSSSNGEPASVGRLRKADSGSGAFVLTVVSGSGGVGKSATAVVAACLSAQRGFHTLLLDCDLQFGDAHALLGKKKAVAIEDVVDSDDMPEALSASDGKPAVLAAPRRLELAEVLVEKIPGLLDDLSEHFDVIVVNTGCGWAECHAMLLERSTCSVFLVDQRASSVRSCIHALDLCKRCGIASGSFAFALNRCERGALFTSVDVSCALQGSRVLELREGGSAVEELLGAGMAYDLLAQGNDFCKSVDAMLDDVLPAQGKKRGRSSRAGSREGAAASKKRSRARAGLFGGRRVREEDGSDLSIALQKGSESDETGFLEGSVRPFFQFGSRAFRGEEAYA